nr:vegetative cell wall protein gp1-like [Chlorocebus sabaeus]
MRPPGSQASGARLGLWGLLGLLGQRLGPRWGSPAPAPAAQRSPRIIPGCLEPQAGQQRVPAANATAACQPKPPSGLVQRNGEWGARDAPSRLSRPLISCPTPRSGSRGASGCPLVVCFPSVSTVPPSSAPPPAPVLSPPMPPAPRTFPSPAPWIFLEVPAARARWRPRVEWGAPSRPGPGSPHLPACRSPPGVLRVQPLSTAVGERPPAAQPRPRNPSWGSGKRRPPARKSSCGGVCRTSRIPPGATTFLAPF